MPPLTYAAQLPGLPPDCLPSLPTYLSCHQSPGVSKTCLDPMAAASRITAERLNSASQATPARSIANSSPPHLLSPLGSPVRSSSVTRTPIVDSSGSRDAALATCMHLVAIT